MDEQFFSALEALSQENSIEKEVLIEKIKEGITKAHEKMFGGS